MKKLSIGLFGTGTVGSGVIEILQNLMKNPHTPFQLKKVHFRRKEKASQLSLPAETQAVFRFEDILEDPEIDTVIELIGGTTDAWNIVTTAIKKGKNVVTANKALIAKYLPELESLLNAHPSIHFRFEAAVGGGIPIIQVLQQNIAAIDNIKGLYGIINGTTNFILSKMEKEQADFQAVLEEAKAKGYAEADPTADIEGFDARAKLAILLRLAFGATLNENKIFTQGITRIRPVDFQYAEMMESTIKLLATAKKGRNGISTFVSPVVVHRQNTLAPINGATNAITVDAKYLQETTLIGQGAGKYPTAEAVVSDLTFIATHHHPTKTFPDIKSTATTLAPIEGRFFIRFYIKDEIGIIRKIAEACEKSGVSIFSVLQLPIEDPQSVPFVLTTDHTSLEKVQQAIHHIKDEPFLLTDPLILPILN